MTIHYDTGDPTPRGRGRPTGSNYDYLDTGPYHDIHRTLSENPQLEFGTIARTYAPEGYNAGQMVQKDSIVKRFRRGYPRWLQQNR